MIRAQCARPVLWFGPEDRRPCRHCAAGQLGQRGRVHRQAPWIEQLWLNKLAVPRMPGETYSDVSLWLAKR